MKRVSFVISACLVILFSLSVMNGYGQQIGINEDGSLPNANALLDIKSYKKGLLIPRMSTSNRLAIPPTKGLLVYDTTTQLFWYNTGSAWQSMSAGSSPVEAWLTTGNTGTTDSNFIGTVDDRPLRFRVNNQTAGRITPHEGNTFLGANSGAASQTTNSWYNTGIGSYSLYRNITGFFNTAAGSHSLYANTTGSENTAMGMEAMIANSTGKHNTAMGSFALNQNTNAIGNNAIGSHALFSNTTGYENTANGMYAMAFNVSGFGNTATGAYALRSSISGIDNTAAGAFALYANTANYNTATGAGALTYNTEGSGNTADGLNALSSNITGSYNTAVGSNAIRNAQTGSYNSALGYYALQAFTTGTMNTSVGAFSNVLAGSNTINATAIGYNAFANASNKVRIGNAAVTRIEGQVPFSTPSDARFKYGVKEDVKGLDFILQLRPVTYNFNAKNFDEQQHGRQNDSLAAPMDKAMENAYTEATAIRRSGFIAQEVEKAANASGYDFSGLIKPKDEKDHYALSYESFVVPMVKAIQELNEKLEDLIKENEALRKEVKQLKQSK